MVGELGPRVALGERGEELRRADRGRRADEADRDRGIGGAPQRQRHLHRLGLRGERRTRLDEKRLAGGRQRDAAWVAHEQHDVELHLQLRESLREGGLRDVQPPGRTRDLALFGNRDEVPQLHLAEHPAS
jgi:hypothetical protein